MSKLKKKKKQHPKSDLSSTGIIIFFTYPTFEDGSFGRVREDGLYSQRKWVLEIAFIMNNFCCQQSANRQTLFQRFSRVPGLSHYPDLLMPPKAPSLPDLSVACQSKVKVATIIVRDSDLYQTYGK